MNLDESTVDLIRNTRALYNSREENYKGRLVIGWEHELTQAELKNGLTYLSREDSDKLLIRDLKRICAKLNKEHIPCNNLSQQQYNALVSLIYDVGLHSVKLSGLFELINNGSYTEAGALFRKWNTYLKQRIYKLTKLRKLEIDLFNT